MKQYLEDMKAREPRIPLPELADEQSTSRDDREYGYERRLRALYLADVDAAAQRAVNRPEETGGSPSRRGFGGYFFENDPNLTLDYRFKTSLFWIVSRTNNCQYCLGHQESKLLGAGMVEDEIAALDGDWQLFSPAERAAFALARKVTLEPHRITGADIDHVREHYSDLQVLEMIVSVAGNNAINRWKEGVGVPQSASGGGFNRRGGGAAETGPHSYLTPTSEVFQSKVTLVAPLVNDPSTGHPMRRAVFSRLQLESRSEVEDMLAACRTRTHRLPLVPEDKAREVLGELAPEGSIPQWMRLLANFPQSGKGMAASILAADQAGDLTPLVKAQVAWIIARQDRAWYAASEAKRRLQDLGQSDDEIYRLDGSWDEFTPQDRALFTVAQKLAASPVVLTDDDVAHAVELTSPREVVQLINLTTRRAALDRITEAAGLATD
jgi:alkylhydroperoxidase family enzyme